MIPIKIYSKIEPEPSGNPLGSALGISLVLRLYFTVIIQIQYSTVQLTRMFTGSGGGSVVVVS